MQRLLLQSARASRRQANVRPSSGMRPRLIWKHNWIALEGPCKPLRLHRQSANPLCYCLASRHLISPTPYTGDPGPTADSDVGFACTVSVSCILQAALLQAVRGYAAKDVRFGIECREAVLAGVNKLADAVQVTLGPKVRQSVIGTAVSSSSATVGQKHCSMRGTVAVRGWDPADAPCRAAEPT